jgi:hypothetical protein
LRTVRGREAAAGMGAAGYSRSTQRISMTGVRVTPPDVWESARNAGIVVAESMVTVKSIYRAVRMLTADTAIMSENNESSPNVKPV